MACCSADKDFMKRFGRIDPWSGRTCIKKKCHHIIGIKGRRSRPLLDLNKSTTASPPASVVAAAAEADSSSSKDAATVLDLSPANLIKCSTSTAKTRPLKKKKEKKKRPKFGAIIKLLPLGKKNNKKIKKKKKDVLH